jgi:hypothetical protein
MAAKNILLPFGMLNDHLVYFPHFVMLYLEKYDYPVGDDLQVEAFY